MRSRVNVEDDSRDGNISYELLMLEVLLDIREQNNAIIEHLRHLKHTF